MTLLHELIYLLAPWAAIFALWAGWHFTHDEVMEGAQKARKRKR